MLKGADNLLNLINLLDASIKIIIVGSPKNNKPKKIYEELRKKKNVFLKGHRDHKETLELIANAKAVINTSYYEGFPNIYLEAWGAGVPVISLNVNPGGIIDKFNLGIYCGGDINKMKAAIELNQTSKFDRNGLKSYVTKFHAFSTAAERFLNVIAVR
jgi:glycosyltransferase involved in cell wall biosynthesis